jgi:ATP-dependent Zn protease
MVVGDIQRRATAHHEAGHAVVGGILGLPCGAVTIEPDQDSVGHAFVPSPWLTLSVWEGRGKFRDVSSAFLASIIARLAGAEAERVLLGTDGVGDDDDRDQILLLVEAGYIEIPLNDWPKFEARLRAQTRRLVRRHQRSIACVAEALMERGTLQADEVVALSK